MATRTRKRTVRADVGFEEFPPATATPGELVGWAAFFLAAGAISFYAASYLAWLYLGWLGRTFGTH